MVCMLCGYKCFRVKVTTKLKLEEAFRSETSVSTYKSTRCQTPEHHNLNSKQCHRIQNYELHDVDLWTRHEVAEIYISLWRPPLSTDQYKANRFFKPVRYEDLTAANVWYVTPWSFIPMYQNLRGHFPKVWNVLGFDQGQAIA
jgi:hypothetical protein